MKKILPLILILLISSCTTKIANFTAVSTSNVRGLEYGGKYRDEIKTVSEKSCTHRVYLTRTILGVFTGVGWFMPEFDLVLGTAEKDRLTDSIDKAIKSGKSSGVFDGDLLVSAVIKEKNIIIPLFYGYKCYIAEGDVVSSTTRVKGFLEKKERN
jgi:hypothetical protein